MKKTHHYPVSAGNRDPISTDKKINRFAYFKTLQKEIIKPI